MNYLKTLLILLAFFGQNGCINPINKSHNSISKTIIELEKTACSGSCPVYVLKISDDGTMWLNAKENLKLTGDYKSKLNQTELNSLLTMFESVDFFNLKNSYQSGMMDLPTKYISYTKNDQTKKIMAYDNIPPELTAIINHIDAYTRTMEWLPVNQ